MFLGGYNVDRDMLGLCVVLEAIQNRPSITIGKTDIKRNCCGSVFGHQIHGHTGGRGNQALESFLASEIQKNRGKVEIVADDKYRAVPVFDIVAIVVDDRD